MTLLITVFAAVIATVKWYTRKDDSMKLGILVNTTGAVWHTAAIGGK